MSKNNEEKKIVVRDERDYDKRVETFKKFAKKVENIEGVEKAVVDDYTPSTAESAQVFVRLESSVKDLGNKTFYEINANLRSITPQIKSVAKNMEHITGHSIFERPEKRYNDFNKSLGYDIDHYLVDIWTH